MDDLEISLDDATQPKKAFDEFFENILGKARKISHTSQFNIR